MDEEQPPTVFYSWQSDLPNKSNRSLIEDALKRACKQCVAQAEDAPRPELDQGAQGVAGSPDIAEAIYAKIERADVVVCE